MADSIDISITAKDLSRAAFSSVESSIGALTGSVKGVTSLAGGMVNAFSRFGLAAQGVQTVASTISGLSKTLLSSNASLEMTTISFKTLLGSTAAANDMIKQLTAFAASTPFELTGLEASTQKLLAFGFSSKEIIPLMTSMGDAISALGGTQENLNSLVYVMGQMRGEAHLNAGDIMQMTNLGIPALQMLAEHYRVTTGEMQTMISKGLVPGKDAVDIFSTSLEKRYGGMMAAQSATFSGMISNMKDWANSTTIILTRPLFDPAKRGLKALLDYVQSPAGVNAVNKLAGYIQTGVDQIAKTFKDAQPPVKIFLAAFNGKDVDGMKGFDTLSGQIATKLGTLAEGFAKLYPIVSPFVIIFDIIKGVLTGGFMGGLKALEGHVIKLGDLFGVDLRPALDGFNTWVSGTAIPTLKSWADTFINDWWPKIQQAVSFVLEKVGQFAGFIAKEVWPKLKDFAGWLGDQGIKIWNSLADTFKNTVMPAIETFSKYVSETLWPKLRDDVFPWIDKNIRPKLEKAFDVIAKDIIPSLGNLIDTILLHVIPTLVTWWTLLATLLSPALKTAGDIIDRILFPAMDLLFGSTKDNKKGIDGMIDGFNRFLGIVQSVANGFHTIWLACGGALLESAIDQIGNIIQMIAILGDVVDAASRGDTTRVMIDAVKAINLWQKVTGTAPVNITGGSDAVGNAGKVRLEQYKMNHPGYDPVAAGNAPKKAYGDSSFMGGPVLWGEAGWERLSLPGGPTLYASGPVYSPDMTGGSKFTPMGGSDGYGAGAGTVVNINLTVNGNPDAAQLSRMKQLARDAVKEGLSQMKTNAQNLRVVNRTRG